MTNEANEFAVKEIARLSKENKRLKELYNYVVDSCDPSCTDMMNIIEESDNGK